MLPEMAHVAASIISIGTITIMALAFLVLDDK